MNLVRLTSAMDVVQHWPDLRKGFLWLKQNAKFPFEEEKTLQQLLFLTGHKDKFYISLGVQQGELKSFVMAFDATPLFSDKKSLQIYALLHRPKEVYATRRVLNGLELWAISHGFEEYTIVSHKFSSPSFRLFSKLGFKKSGVILIKEF